MAQPFIFISYSREDEDKKDILLTHLKGLQQAGRITLWSDDQITPGTHWQESISQAIAHADIALLLIANPFEELYTLCHDATIRQKFLDVLRQTVRTVQEPILTLGVDSADRFYGPLGWVAEGRVLQPQKIQLFMIFERRSVYQVTTIFDKGDSVVDL